MDEQAHDNGSPQPNDLIGKRPEPDLARPGVSLQNERLAATARHTARLCRVGPPFACASDLDRRGAGRPGQAARHAEALIGVKLSWNGRGPIRKFPTVLLGQGREVDVLIFSPPKVTTRADRDGRLKGTGVLET